MRAYEVLTALSAVAEIILEETAENNRIQLETDPENRWSSESRAKRLAA